MLQMLLHVSIVHVIKLSLGTGTFVLPVRYSTTYVRTYIHTAVRTYSTSTCTYCILHVHVRVLNYWILFMSVCQMSVQTYIVKLHVVHILEHTYMCTDIHTYMNSHTYIHNMTLHTEHMKYIQVHESHIMWSMYMYMYVVHT